MQRTKNLEENKIKTRQQIKKGKSKRCCRLQSTWIIIALLLHRYCSAVTQLSLRCRSVVALLSHRYRYAVDLLSLRCRTAIAPLLFRCCSATVSPLLRCCRTAIAPVSLHCCSSDVAPAVDAMLHRYHTTVAPMLSLLLSLRSRTAIAPLSRHCHSAAVSPVVATQSHRYCSVVAPLSNRCRSGPERV